METTIEPHAPPVQQQAALWEDYIDIFYAPRQVFRRRLNGRFAITLLVLTVLMTALFFASRGPLAAAMETELQRGLASTPQGRSMTAEQVEQMRSMSGIIGTFATALMFPLAVIITGMVAWFVARFFDTIATLGMCIMVVTYAQFPRVLQSASTLAQALVLEPATLNAVALSPARFLDAATVSPVVLGLLARLDIFILWSTILIAIGLQVVGKLPPARAYMVAVIVWLLGAAPVLAAALAR